MTTVQESVRSIASKYLKRVRASGPNDIMAVCPFHMKMDGSSEKHPSFAMSLSKGVYYCHACHARGNLRSFLIEMGVDQRIIHSQYETLLNSLLRSYTPTNSEQTVGSYFGEEPLPEGILGLFGFCPLPLVDKDYAEPEDPVYDETFIQSLGIGYDIKHNRITFPLRSTTGELVGISGRTTIGEWPRYKVYSTEYEAYGLPARSCLPRGSIVWNYENTYPDVSRKMVNRACVVVEGFKACLSVLAAGLNAVALLGSHMTYVQQLLLEKLGCTLYLMLDNDEAGQNGLIQMAPKLANCCPVKVVEYEGKQPSSLTKDQILEAIDNASNYYLICNTWRDKWHTEKTQVHYQ